MGRQEEQLTHAHSTHSHTQLMHTTPLSMHGRSALDAVGMAYAREVYVRNESRLQGLSHNLVTTFHEASKNFVDKVSESVCMRVCVGGGGLCSWDVGVWWVGVDCVCAISSAWDTHCSKSTIEAYLNTTRMCTTTIDQSDFPVYT